MLVASVSFHVDNPGCASFDLALAGDGKIRSAQLNGHALTVPSHDFRYTTAQTGTAGLTAARGKNLFSYGTNSLVLTVANDAGAIGLYVEGAVQLLCPLDEATISMRPSQGPATGGTLLELRSNVQVSCRIPLSPNPATKLIPAVLPRMKLTSLCAFRCAFFCSCMLNAGSVAISVEQAHQPLWLTNQLSNATHPLWRRSQEVGLKWSW